MDAQKFCLKWDGFQGSVTSLFDTLRQHDELVDVTLCCEGQQVRAHRMMLSACSPYFRDLLKNNQCQNMIIFLKDTSSADLHAIIEFMYKGSVNVAQSQLASFIKTAEMLQIRGLSGDDDKQAAPPSTAPSPRRSAPAEPPPPRPRRSSPPPAKRRRHSGGGGSSGGSQHAWSPAPPAVPPSVQAHQQEAASAPGGGFLAGESGREMEVGAETGVVQGESGESAPAAGGDVGVPRSEGNHHQTQPATALPGGEPVKVEKFEVDLTEDDEEQSLDATLSHVADFEGGYEDQSVSGFDGAMPDLSMSMPGPSQRGAAGAIIGDDGSGAGQYKCTTCGRTYRHKQSLNAHMLRHTELTVCPVCHKAKSTVQNLRKHLAFVHHLSTEEIQQMVPSLVRVPQV